MNMRENLPVAEPIAQHQEILSYAATLPFTPTLQRRTVPSIHPHATVERSSAAMSPPEPPHWTVGHLPIPPRMQTLLVPWLQAYLQRPHRYPAASEPATTAVLDSRHLLLCLACSSRRIARELGIHIRTSYRWCWWLRNAALSYEMQRQLTARLKPMTSITPRATKVKPSRAGRSCRRARGRRKKREPGRPL